MDGRIPNIVFRSFMVKDPALIARVLTERPDDFPKPMLAAEGLRPLLDRSVFVTIAEVWKRQRQIINPAFEGSRLRDTLPAIWAAGDTPAAWLTEGVVEIYEQTSHTAADVIFRTLLFILI